MTKALLFRKLLIIWSIGSLALLSGCPSEPGVPAVDSGGGIDGGAPDTGPAVDGGPRDTGGGGGDTGNRDSGVSPDTGVGSDTGTGGDAGSCVAADCDDGNPCNGVEVCEADLTCGPGTAVGDGTACDIDGDPATVDLCVAGLCGPSRCGDMFTSAGEDCDDGNDVNDDGCDACVFSCAAAADCDDGNPCTGTETCGADHVCAAGTAAADGTTCGGANICMAGVCVPPACATAADCDNGLRCDGVETCTATMCGSGTAVDCDDASDCTADSCAEAGAMCLHTLVDADADGHAPTALGACGTDCDDTSATVNPDAVDACGDGIDNDCNGTVDDGGMTTYYADCDGDDYAASGAAGVSSCLPPTPSLTGCTTGGAWTTRDPATPADSDCNDANPAVNPGQTVYQTTAIAGEPVASDFDYDCDSLEDQQVIARGGCMRVGLASCLYTSGWEMTAAAIAPECGVEGTFVDSCSAVTCTAVTSMRTQSCL